MSLPEIIYAIRQILDRRTKRTLVWATAASVLIALFDAFALALILPLVSLATGGEDTSGVGALVAEWMGDPEPNTLVLWLTIAVVTFFVLKDLGAIAYTWWLTGFKVLRRVDLSTRLLQHLLYAPYTQISRRSSAELLRTVNDAVLQFFGTTVFGLMTLVANVASLLTITVALLVSAPMPSLVLALYLGAGAAFYLRVMKPRTQAAGVIAAEASSAAYRTAFAALGGIKEAKLRGSQPFFVDGYRDAALRGAYASRTAGFIASLPRYLLEILFILAVGALLFLGLATGGEDGTADSFGVLALFVAAGLRALPAITSLMAQISNLRFGVGFLQVVLDEVATARETRIDTLSIAAEPLRMAQGIRLAGVGFTYPDGSSPAVRDVRLEIPRGSSLALVGGSGAGKTTLVDLLLGLHRPTEGSILVDGHDISEVIHRWQRSVGYVPQEVFLREASLAENVAFDQHAADIDEDRLRMAIRRAQLDDVVTTLEQGVWTSIGERGSRLSGGQKQRIGIARALYQQPQLLVLDEATSALDNETEHRVSEALRELHGQLTTVIVAHRLSTVRNVDSVALLHEGRVEAVGNFEELRALSPRFERMVRLGSLE